MTELSRHEDRWDGDLFTVGPLEKGLLFEMVSDDYAISFGLNLEESEKLARAILE